MTSVAETTLIGLTPVSTEGYHPLVQAVYVPVVGLEAISADPNAVHVAECTQREPGVLYGGDLGMVMPLVCAAYGDFYGGVNDLRGRVLVQPQGRYSWGNTPRSVLSRLVEASLRYPEVWDRFRIVVLSREVFVVPTSKQELEEAFTRDPDRLYVKDYSCMPTGFVLDTEREVAPGLAPVRRSKTSRSLKAKRVPKEEQNKLKRRRQLEKGLLLVQDLGSLALCISSLIESGLKAQKLSALRFNGVSTWSYPWKPSYTSTRVFGMVLDQMTRRTNGSLSAIERFICDVEAAVRVCRVIRKARLLRRGPAAKEIRGEYRKVLPWLAKYAGINADAEKHARRLHEIMRAFGISEEFPEIPPFEKGAL